jgi:hypothetical protein
MIRGLGWIDRAMQCWGHLVELLLYLKGHTLQRSLLGVLLLGEADGEVGLVWFGLFTLDLSACMLAGL